MEKIRITNDDLPPGEPRQNAAAPERAPALGHTAAPIAAIAAAAGTLGLFCLCVGCPFMFIDARSAHAHPVFDTPIETDRPSRPAVQVHVIDDSEHLFFRAELYLAVQSSRFPGDTWVVVPLNGGDFAGCRERFVQLPFAVGPEDRLVFNLLDNDEMTYDQEALLLNGCRAGGYAVVFAGDLYCPSSAEFVEPIAMTAAEALGNAVIEDVRLHGFENFGTAEIRVGDLPLDPGRANEVSLRSGSRARATLRLYQPPDELSWGTY